MSTNSRSRRLLAQELAGNDNVVFVIALMFGFDPKGAKDFVADGDERDKIGLIEDAILSGIDVLLVHSKCNDKVDGVKLASQNFMNKI